MMKRIGWIAAAGISLLLLAAYGTNDGPPTLPPETTATVESQVAWMYENGRGCEVDYHEARLLYKKAAELGNGTAYCHLGKIYEKGLGVSPNLNKAIEYYSVAAQKGNQAAKKKLEELSLS